MTAAHRYIEAAPVDAPAEPRRTAAEALADLPIDATYQRVVARRLARAAEIETHLRRVLAALKADPWRREPSVDKAAEEAELALASAERGR